MYSTNKAKKGRNCHFKYIFNIEKENLVKESLKKKKSEKH